jgi:predicted N-formylglutamate amidohydrolase
MTKIATFEGFEQVEGEAAGGLLLLCDHASNALPAGYGSLGLPPEEFTRHIAYDIGARDLTLALARHFGAPALLTRHSRLLIDPNRGLDDPTLIMKLSDGAVVPGNAAIDAAERGNRIARYHQPYHRAITAGLDAMLAAGIVPVIISIHSFTPVWRGWPRPWHVGLLWDRDARLVRPMIAALRAEPGLVVGDNEPYSGSLEGDTLSIHGTARGIPHVLIEVRQDLIAEKSGVDEWARRLANVIEPIMYDPSIVWIDGG